MSFSADNSPIMYSRRFEMSKPSVSESQMTCGSGFVLDMKRIVPFALAFFLGIAAPLSAQTVTEQKPNEAEVAANKRRAEILRHPKGFITFRLAASGREPSTTPPPYTADNWMHFEMFVSLASGEDLTYLHGRHSPITQLIVRESS